MARKAEISRLILQESEPMMLNGNHPTSDNTTMRRTSGRSWIELQAILARSGQSAMERMGLVCCPNERRENDLFLSNPDDEKKAFSLTITSSDFEHAVSSFSPPGESTTGCASAKR